MNNKPTYSLKILAKNLKKASVFWARILFRLLSKIIWFWKHIIFVSIVIFLILAGSAMIWVSTLKIPDLQSFQETVLAGSTKIYDRTGEILLYDLNKDMRRIIVPFENISKYVKDATISIEDDKFYQHKGVDFTSIIRAIVVDLQQKSLKQGGSTITQQVIKNTLLTTDKRFSRKIKEWVLAIKLEKIMPKDEILNLYLNSSPYGGNYYGIETASENYFGKSAKDLSIAESAYLAALPQAPSYYSPYGNHRDALDTRKNIVLQKMKENGYITESEYKKAKAEKVTFLPQQNQSIKAPHFVMFIKDYITQKYGDDMVKNGSLKVITSLDYELQSKAEAIVKKFALENTEKFNASNAALVAIDPKTGQILTMVGSRDYFDKNIDGNFNVTLAHRQPGSAFKPFAYATAFGKGFTPDTVLFDLKTQFSTTCDADGNPKSPESNCYTPENYDLQFSGPISMRNALAQSRNVPAIKTLYLAGMKETLKTAKDLGISSLKDQNQYGLTLVLGGGEVSPLEMTSAYSVFANNGLRNPYTGIISITDKNGNILEQFESKPNQVIDEQVALTINNVLSDNTARMPLNGPNSATDFPNAEVALKTGTTNDYRDTWIIGYTPSISVGAWAGNNDNSPMVKKTSGLIIAPLWRAFMNEAIAKYSPTPFKKPNPINTSLRPILRGVWQGGQTYTIDITSGKLATELTPQNLRKEIAIPNIHSILYWVNKNNPNGPAPLNPASDSQFELWEKPVLIWAAAHSAEFPQIVPPTQIDDSHTPESAPRISIISPSQNSKFKSSDKILVAILNQSRFPLKKIEFYVNNNLIGTASGENTVFSFVPEEISDISETNKISVIVYDTVENKSQAETTFIIE